MRAQYSLFSRTNVKNRAESLVYCNSPEADVRNADDVAGSEVVAVIGKHENQ